MKDNVEGIVFRYLDLYDYRKRKQQIVRISFNLLNSDFDHEDLGLTF